MSKKHGKKGGNKAKISQKPAQNTSKSAQKPMQNSPKSAQKPQNASKSGIQAKVGTKGAKKFKFNLERFNKRRLIWIGSALAAILLALGGGIGIALLNNQPQEPEIIEVEPEPEPEPEIIVNEDPLEPEPTITNNANYQVAAHKPRYLSIPSISLYNIPIIEVGKEGDGTLGAPTSDYVIAWYYRSALPGQPGAVVMDGHGGDLGTGILKNLKKAPMGAEIIIEMGDGRKFTYIIEERTYKPIGKEADSYMNVVYQPLRPGTSTLSLITCDGAWIRSLQTYDQRLFVRATMR